MKRYAFFVTGFFAGYAALWIAGYRGLACAVIGGLSVFVAEWFQRG